MNAYMIMAHKNPLQIIRLSKKLQSVGGNVFIHLDSFMSNEDIRPIVEFSNQHPRIYVCKKRIHGELDKRSLIDIVFLIVDEVKYVEETTSVHFDYFLLLSGQDYPIKNVNFIEKELKEVYPKPYIDCTPYDRHNWVYHKFAYYKKSASYHNWITHNFKKGLVRSFLRVTALLWEKVVPIFFIDSYHKLSKINVELYGGSAWWILPDTIMDFILDKYTSNDEMVDILLNESVTPEETFFQIMAMRSALAQMVDVNPKEMVLQNCKTWAYFSDNDKEFMGHPYVFTINEFDKLKHSDCWFARKFDETVDSEVMDKIDKEILD